MRKRNKLTESQTEVLMKHFQVNAYPERKEIDQLAKSFNVNRKKIENWFGTKRLKLAREGMMSRSEYSAP